MKTIFTNPSRTKFAELKDCIQRGQQAFIQAGEIVVDLIEAGSGLDALHEATDIPMDVLAQLERIGRKQLNPHLLLSDFPAARAMERLPLSEQNRLLNEPVDVFIFRDGAPDKMSIPAPVLTSKQTRQVFGRNYVRPLNEQRSFLEASKATDAQIIKRDVPYEITRRHTVIIGGNEFTVSELLRIAAMAQE